MAYSIINVSDKKPKTYDHLTRLQEYLEKRTAGERAPDQTPDAWRAVRDDLRAGMTPGNYDTWIGSARVRQDGDRLIIGTPDEFGREWLERRLDDRIRAALERTGHGHLQPAYEVSPPDPGHADGPRVLMSRDDWAAYTRHRLDELGIRPRQGKESDRYNSPLAIHYTLTASRQWFEEHPEQTEQWIAHSAGFIRQLHGEDQILGIVVHEHQSTLHLHIAAIPIDPQTGRLRASAFTRTREQLAALHTQYNTYLRERGLQLERGHNYALERAKAAASPAEKQLAVHADAIPLHEALERLEADRDERDPRRWIIGDRLIQVHDDGHGFTEFSPFQAANDGYGAIDLVIRLRQEGETPLPGAPPLEQHTLAVEYLAALHPERVTADGTAPPLVPHAPEPAPRPPLVRESMPFGQESRWEPGQFILVDSLPEAVTAMGASTGWGRIAVVEHPEALPVDELDEAIVKGWMVDVATTSDAVWAAVQERYADQTLAQGRQVWRSPTPSAARAKAAARPIEMERRSVPDPEIMMGGL